MLCSFLYFVFLFVVAARGVKASCDHDCCFNSKILDPTKAVAIDLFFLLHCQLWWLISACLDWGKQVSGLQRWLKRENPSHFSDCISVAEYLLFIMYILRIYESIVTSEDHVFFIDGRAIISCYFLQETAAVRYIWYSVNRRLTLALLAFTGCSTNLRHFALKHIQHCARVGFILLRLSVFPRFGRKTWYFG